MVSLFSMTDLVQNVQLLLNDFEKISLLTG